MGSHKQRVQRKIKKEVKRKAQAHRAQQQRTNGAKSDKSTELMKMMMTMMGGGNKQPPGDLPDKIRLIEEQKKLENDLKRQELESKKRIEEMARQTQEAMNKAKLEGLQRTEDFEKQKNEFTQKKLDAEAEIDKLVKAGKLDEAQAKARRAEVERNFRLRMAELEAAIQGYNKDAVNTEYEILGTEEFNKLLKKDIEGRKQQLGYIQLKWNLNEIQKKFQNNIEKFKVLEQTLPEQANNVRDALVILNKTQDVLKDKVVDLLTKYKDAADSEAILKQLGLDQALANVQKIQNELLVALSKKKLDVKTLEQKQAQLEKLTMDNAKKQAEVDNLDDQIKRATYKYIKGPEGKYVMEADEKANPVTIDLDQELVNARKMNNELKAQKTFKANELERKTKKQLKLQNIDAENDALEIENAGLKATNDAMKTPQVTPTKFKKNAQLQQQNKELQDQIDHKEYGQKLINQMNDELFKAQLKFGDLQAKNDATPEPTVPDFTESAKLQHKNEEIQDQLDTKNKKKDRIKQMQDETDKLNLQIKQQQAYVDSFGVTDKDDEDILPPAYEQAKRKLEKLKQQSKTLEVEREARAKAKEVEMLQNDKQIQESEDQIVDELAKQEVLKQRTKANEQLIHEMNTAKERDAALRAKQKAQENADQNDGIVDFTAQLAVLNDDMNTQLKQEDLKQQYVREKREGYLAEIRENPNMLPTINQYLEHKNIKGLEVDAFNTMTTREQADAWGVLKEGVHDHFQDPNFDAIDEDQNVQIALQTLFDIPDDDNDDD